MLEHLQMQRERKHQHKKIKQKQEKKELGCAQKLLDIARVRGYDAQEVFTYDLVKTSYLLDKDGLMKKPTKHELVRELGIKYYSR